MVDHRAAQFRAEPRDPCVNRGGGAAENTGMSRIWLGIGVVALSGVVAAQVKQEQPSLGVVAKATKEQRAKAKAAADAKAASKPATYTNENLDGRPRPSAPTAYRTAVRSASMVKSGSDGKDEAYWRRRAEPIRQQLAYSTERLSAAKKRLDALKPMRASTSPSPTADRRRLKASDSDRLRSFRSWNHKFNTSSRE
jgi:hypothetical protein